MKAKVTKRTTQHGTETMIMKAGSIQPTIKLLQGAAAYFDKRTGEFQDLPDRFLGEYKTVNDLNLQLRDWEVQVNKKYSANGGTITSREIREILRPGITKRKSGDIWELAEVWHEERTKRYSTTTTEQDLTSIKNLRRAIPEMTLNMVNASAMEDLFDWLKDYRKEDKKGNVIQPPRGLSDGTILNRLTDIRTFFLWLHSRGYVKKHNLSDFDMPDKGERESHKPLTTEQVKALLQVPVVNDRHREKLAKDLFFIGVRTGFRISELLSAQVEDGKIGSYVKKKRGKKVWLEKKVTDSIQLVLNKYGGQIPYLSRNSANKALRELARRSGIEEFTSHTLRATYIRTQLDAGVDLFKVQKSVAHENVNTTLGYAGYEFNDQLQAETADVLEEAYG